MPRRHYRRTIEHRASICAAATSEQRRDTIRRGSQPGASGKRLSCPTPPPCGSSRSPDERQAIQWRHVGKSAPAFFGASRKASRSAARLSDESCGFPRSLKIMGLMGRLETDDRRERASAWRRRRPSRGECGRRSRAQRSSRRRRSGCFLRERCVCASCRPCQQPLQRIARNRPFVVMVVAQRFGQDHLHRKAAGRSGAGGPQGLLAAGDTFAQPPPSSGILGRTQRAEILCTAGRPIGCGGVRPRRPRDAAHDVVSRHPGACTASAPRRRERPPRHPARDPRLRTRCAGGWMPPGTERDHAGVNPRRVGVTGLCDQARRQARAHRVAIARKGPADRLSASASEIGNSASSTRRVSESNVGRRARHEATTGVQRGVRCDRLAALPAAHATAQQRDAQANVSFDVAGEMVSYGRSGRARAACSNSSASSSGRPRDGAGQRQ